MSGGRRLRSRVTAPSVCAREDAMVVSRAHPESLRWCEATTLVLRQLKSLRVQYRLKLFPVFSLEIWNAGREPHSSDIPDKQYGVLTRKRGKRRQDIIDSEIPVRLEWDAGDH